MSETETDREADKAWRKTKDLRDITSLLIIYQGKATYGYRFDDKTLNIMIEFLNRHKMSGLVGWTWRIFYV